MRRRGYGYSGPMANSDPGAPGRVSPGLGTVALDQPFDLDGLYTMRSALIAHGSELGAAGEVLDRLVLVASELATNAIRHGGGSGRLRLWRSGDAVVCEITDAGPGIADPWAAGSRRADPQEAGGRGLWICRQLSDTLTIAAGATGAVVTASILLARPA